MSYLNLFYNQHQTLIKKALNENYSEKDIYNTIYRKEFETYLRKGIEPRLSELNQVMQFVRNEIIEKAVKQFYFEESYNQKQTTNNNNFEGKKYIWRTEKDSKTRSRHLSRDGKTYIWGENDLEPGQDFNCRCHAEFIDEEGNKIGLGRLKFDENKKPFLNELNDKEKGLKALNENAEKLEKEWKENSDNRNKEYYGNGKCAKYTRIAIEEAGFQIEKTELAKNYGTSLKNAGFEEILNVNEGEEVDIKYSPRKGDIAVLQPHLSQKEIETSNGKEQAGHMAMFDGENWISDFKQNNQMYGSATAKKEKPALKIYRSDDW